MIKDVIRLKWQASLSHEQIAASLNISKGAVAKYVGLAGAAGLDWDTVQSWSEKQLAGVLLPRTTGTQPFIEPDGGLVHRELDRKGMTLMLLWQEYVAAHPEVRTWRYTQFCEHYKDFARRLKRSMRQHRRAGQKMFIDFAGSTVGLLDGARAQVFVSAMAASSYVFACATPAQRLDGLARTWWSPTRPSDRSIRTKGVTARTEALLQNGVLRRGDDGPQGSPRERSRPGHERLPPWRKLTGRSLRANFEGTLDRTLPSCS